MDNTSVAGSDGPAETDSGIESSSTSGASCDSVAYIRVAIPALDVQVSNFVTCITCSVCMCVYQLNLSNGVEFPQGAVVGLVGWPSRYWLIDTLFLCICDLKWLSK